MSQITRTERVQAFLFLLIGLVVTGAVVLTLLDLRFGQSPRTYYLQFPETVSGLTKGTPVRYGGVKCGKVAAIDVDERNPEIIKVELALDDKAPIRVSTIAEIATDSILSPYHIELHGSRRTSPNLPEKSYIPTSASTLQKLLATGKTLADELPQVVADLKPVIKNLALWTDETHQTGFFSTVEEVKEAAREIKLTLRSVRRAIDEDDGRLLKASADLAEEVVDFLKRNGPRIDELLFHLVKSVEHVESLLASGTIEDTALSLRSAVGRVADEVDRSGAAVRQWMEDNHAIPYLERAVASVESLEKYLAEAMRTGVTPALRELGQAAADLGRFIELLERQPSALIFGSPPPKKPLPGNKR